MVSDRQVRRVKRLTGEESTAAEAAAKADVDEKTARKYLRSRELPRQMSALHTWRARELRSCHLVQGQATVVAVVPAADPGIGVKEVSGMIELFDAQAGFGGGRPGDPWVPSSQELLESMERLSVSLALVRTEFEEMDTDPMYSNRLLYEACARHPSLVPCPTVLPTGHGDVPSERAQVDELVARGAGAATLRPGQDGWITAEWCAGALLRRLEERRVPVLCRHSAVGFEALGDLAARYPRLPIVLFQLGYRAQRVLVSLLRAFPNVHLAVGSPYSVHLGLESLAGQVGPERLLFGTGFPYAEPMASITMLTYSELAEADRQLVGSGNLHRLIRGIQR